MYGKSPAPGNGWSALWGYDARPSWATTNPFMIVDLPDTQYYSSTYPSISLDQTQWIVDNKKSQNIVFATQTGDIVDDGSSSTQWANADAAANNLDGVIPYSMTFGNHDFDDVAAGTGTVNFTANFGPSRYQKYSWFGGASTDGLAMYQTFSADGYTFLHLNIPYTPSSADLNWAAGILAAHPSDPTIISTHDYLYNSGTSTYRTSVGDGIWNSLVTNNSQVFMVLGSHFYDPDEGQLVSTGNAGQNVIQTLADYQDQANGGDGWLRQLIFDPGAGLIRVRTYSPYLGSFNTGTSSQFAYSVTFGSQISVGSLCYPGDWCVGTGNWSTAGNWTQGCAPINGNTTILTFGGSSAYTSTNNLVGVFTLNKMNFANTRTVTVGQSGSAAGLNLDGSGAAINVNGIGIVNITAPVAILADTTVNVAAGAGQFSLQAADSITGSGNLTIANSSAYPVLLGNAGGFTGNIHVQAGTVQLSNTGGNALSNSTILTIDSGATFDFNQNSESFGGLSGGGTVVADNTWLGLTSTGSQTFSGNISGVGGSINLSGTGAVSLTGTSTYTGGTTISSGARLQVNSDGALGAVPSKPQTNITLDGGQLFNTNAAVALSGSRNISVTANGGFFEAAYGQNFTVNGQISGPGGLGIAWDDGAVVLAGSNSYAGATTIGTTAGSTYWPSPYANPILRLANNNVLPGGDLFFGVSSGTYGNTATLDMNGYNATVGMLSAGTNGIVDVESAGASTLTVGKNNASSTFGGVLQDSNANGTLSLTKTGNGTLTLTNNNTYSGATTIDGGTLAAGASASLGSGGLTLNGGTFKLNGFCQTVAALSGSGGNIALGGGTLTTGSDNSSTAAAAVISGNGSLVKLGTGNQTLTGANTYSGGTTISGGTLQLGCNGAVNASLAGNIVNNATLSFANANPQTYSNVISGSGRVVQWGSGAATLAAANTYSGGTTISGAGLLINGDSALGAVPDSPQINITLDGGQLYNTNSTVTLSGSRTVSLTANGGFFEAAYSQNFTVNGQISGPGGLGIAWDDGAVVLAGSNSYAGTTTIGTTAGSTYWAAAGANPTLRLANNNALPGGDLIFGVSSGTYGNTATLDMNGYNATVGMLSGGVNAIVDVESAGASTLTVGKNNASSTFGGVLQDSNANGTLSLTKTGNGTLTLTNNNTYSGGTTLGGGLLALGSSSSLGSGGLTLNGGTLGLNGIRESVAALSGAGGSIALGGGTLTTGSANSSTTAAAVISGNGSLVKIGTGTQTLAGANTYTGGTTISGGTLAVAAIADSGPSNLGDAGSVTLSGGDLQYTGATSTSTTRGFSLAAGAASQLDVTQAAGRLTINAAFAGSSASQLTKLGPGTLTLSGSTDNSSLRVVVQGGMLVLAKSSTSTAHALGAANAPALTITAGTAQLAGSGGDQLYEGSNVVVNGGVFDFNGRSEGFNALSGTGGIVTNSSATPSTMTVGQNGGSGTFSGVLRDGAGTMALAVAGGTLTLTNSSTYSGGTTISGGALALGYGNFSNGSVAGNITDNGALYFKNASLQTCSNAVSGSGSLVMQGSGTTVLSGDNSFQGGTFVDTGTLILASQEAAPNGSALVVGAGGMLLFDPTAAGAALQEAGARPIASVTAVPEPGTVWLLLAGLGLVLVRRLTRVR